MTHDSLYILRIEFNQYLGIFTILPKDINNNLWPLSFLYLFLISEDTPCFDSRPK